jgi:hypothetical protein
LHEQNKNNKPPVIECQDTVREYNQQRYRYIQMIFELSLNTFLNGPISGEICYQRMGLVMETKSKLIVSSVFVTFLVLSAGALAQGTSNERSACMGDAFKFCGADIPDVGKIEACLSQNRASLTPACAAEFQPAQKTLLKREHFRKN